MKYFFLAFKSKNLFIELSIFIFFSISFSMDKIVKDYNLSSDTDDRKNVFIRFSLLKLLLSADIVMGIVGIILNTIQRFGITSCT